MFKIILGTIAVLLTFIGYIPYIRDILKGKTKPHIYSWFIWFLTPLLVFILQISNDAGAGAFVTLAAALMSLLVIILAKKYGNVSRATFRDKFFIFLALIAIGLWLFAKQPILSVILAVSIGFLGFLPTIRKSWHQPFSENLTFYYFNILRFFLAFCSLGQYTFVTAFYPAFWFLANAGFALMMNLRRPQVRNAKKN